MASVNCQGGEHLGRGYRILVAGVCAGEVLKKQ